MSFLRFVFATLSLAGCSVGAPTSPPSRCAAPPITIEGLASRRFDSSAAEGITAELEAAFDRAASVATVESPARVRLSGGYYPVVRELDVPSHLRLDIDPSSTIIAALPVPEGADELTTARAVFVFGSALTPVHDVTIAAGDGCGGRGVATWTNKLATTAERGNSLDGSDATGGCGGMANITRDGRAAGEPLPLRELEPWGSILGGMWVMDLDARANADLHASRSNIGFELVNAYDVEISDVFSIQNSERDADASHPSCVPKRSARAVFWFQPPRSARWPAMNADISAEQREALPAPHRVRVRRHFNVLAPADYGNTQVYGCIDCTFERLFGHGGVPMRFETGVPNPTHGVDSGRGPNVCPSISDTYTPGVGFAWLAWVDGTRASWIDGRNGNATVLLNPHCHVNGSVFVDHVRGRDQQYVLALANAQNLDASGVPTERRGQFASTTSVAHVVGVPSIAGELTAQTRTAGQLVGASVDWTPTRSEAAVASLATFPMTLSGEVCWPERESAVLIAPFAAPFAGTSHVATGACPPDAEWPTEW